MPTVLLGAEHKGKSGDWPAGGKPSSRAGLENLPGTWGRVAEWFKALVLKTSDGESRPWVRIPPLPPMSAPVGKQTLSALSPTLSFSDERMCPG